MGNGATEKVIDTGDKPHVDPPSDPKDAYERFLKVREDKVNAAKLDPPSPDDKGQKADLNKPIEKELPPEKNPWEGLRIVDKDGNPAKLPISVDGEKSELDDMNKIGTAVQFGLHHDKTGAAFKTEKEEFDRKVQDWDKETANFKAGMPFLSKLKEALEAGTLKMAEDGTISKPSGAAINPDHIPITEEDKEHADPQYLDLVERFNKMIDSNAKQGKTIEGLQTLQIKQLFKETKTEIDSTIAKLKPKYPHSSEKEIIDLLAELDENKRPKYNIEQAMEISQKNVKTMLDNYVAKDPDFMEKTEAQKKVIIKEYLDKVNDKNSPPVSGPQGTGAGGSAILKKDVDPNKPLGPEDHKLAAKKSFEGAAAFLTEKLAKGKTS